MIINKTVIVYIYIDDILLNETNDDEITHVYQCSQCSNQYLTETDFNIHKCPIVQNGKYVFIFFFIEN